GCKPATAGTLEPYGEAPADHGSGEEGGERGQRPHQREPRHARERESQKHHVAGHVRGEHSSEAEPAHRVDQTHGSRQPQKEEREVPKPPAKVAGARVVDLIPVSLSGETWQDAEPFLALYASNPRLMAASAFTPNPGGSASATAPIFVSDDGGDSWTLRNTVPSQTMTADITHAVGGNPPMLYAGILKVPDFPLNELKANDFFSPATMTLQGFRADIDQPFV